MTSSVLRQALENHRPQLVVQLNCNTHFLSRLRRLDLLDPGDYESVGDPQQRNRLVVEGLLQRSSAVEDAYSKLLEVLRQTNQSHLAAILTNVDTEIDLVDDYQNRLASHLRTVDNYLKTESRRSEVHFSESARQSRDDFPTQPHHKIEAQQAMDREAMTEFLYRVHQTTKTTLLQFDRCRDVISKLHKDCDEVARKNAETLSKLRDCQHLVSSLMPSLGLETTVPERVDVQSRSSAEEFTPRSKKTEPEAIVTAVRKNLNAIADELIARDDGRKRIVGILSNVVKDIHERRLALSRHTDVDPRISKANKYLVGLPPLNQGPTHLNSLSYKVEELAEQMEAYIHQETQLTNKMALTKLQTSNVHRNFDQVDRELMHLQKELRHNDKDRALLFAANIISSTRGEREECVHMVDDMERMVHTRRLKLQETNEKSLTRLRRRPQRKVNVVQKVESNFAKRLNDLRNELNMYMDLELDLGQRFKVELLKKRQEHETQLKRQRSENREVNNQLRQSHNERDKYKKLYDQEKAINNAKRTQAKFEREKAKRQVKQMAAAQAKTTSTERRGILRRPVPPPGPTPETRTRRTVKPKLTPRARDFIQLKEGHTRQEARVRSMQLIREEAQSKDNNLKSHPRVTAAVTT